MKQDVRKLTVSVGVSDRLLGRIRTDGHEMSRIKDMLSEMLARAIVDEGYAEIKEERQGYKSKMVLEVLVLVNADDYEKGGQND